MIHNVIHLIHPHDIGDLAMEYSLGGAIYDLTTNESDLLFTAQEDAVRKYAPATKTPTSIFAAKSQKLAYCYGETYYLRWLYYNGSVNVTYYYNGSSVSGPGGQTSALGAKKSTIQSYYDAYYRPDYSLDASVANYNNIRNSTFTLYHINSICSVGTDCYFQGNEYGFANRFRKYSDATTNLAYPSTGLQLTKLSLSNDGTKIYGLEGSYPYGWNGGTTLYVYTIASNSWATISLPSNYKGFQAIEYNGNLFVTGYNSATGRAALLKYNGSTFDVINGMYTRLYCAVILGSILYLGGADGNIYTYTE